MRWPIFALLVVVALAGVFRVHNLDIHLHARTGEWIVDHAEVPDRNVLSELHAEWPTVHDKWGFQVAAHGLFDGLGPNAVLAARVALLLLLFGLMASTARALGADAAPVLLFGLLALVAARTRFTFRPDLVSLVLLAAAARLSATGPPDLRRVLALAGVQVLWVNVHGYFLQGPMVVAVAGLRDRRWLGVALLMVALCLVNPSGLDGALHPVRILDDLRDNFDFYSDAILEFRPTFADDLRHPFDRLAFFVLGAAAIVLLARRRDGNGLALVVLFGLQALSLRRNMAPFAVVAAPLAAAALGSRRGLAAAGLALAALVAWGEVSDATSIHDGHDRRWGTGMSRLAYPDAGIAFIAEQLPEASVFTAFSYGSTFTGLRWPEQVASLNGNTHGYPTSFLQEALSAISGADPRAFDRIVERDGHDAALIPAASPLSLQLVNRPDWALAFLGGREAVFVRGEGADVFAPMLDTPEAGPPLFEIDQATLLWAAGRQEQAVQRASDAVARSAEDATALGLLGLFLHHLGRADEARDVLRRSLDAGGFNPLSADVRAALSGG